MVEFVSYNGEWPSLCCGDLVIKVNGKEYSEGLKLRSGGSIWIDFDNGGDGTVTGPWTVSVPDELEPYIEEIEDVVNANVPWGCCGGCI